MAHELPPEQGDRARIRLALTQLQRDTKLPVVFGGPVAGRRHPTQIRLSELAGTATEALRDLVVTTGFGLGGRAAVLGRVVAVSDYCRAVEITHDYDRAVATEGLRAIVAVPVVVRRVARAVLYGASRTAGVLGDRVLSQTTDAARTLEQDLVLRDEVAERMTVLAAAAEPGGPAREDVRLAYTELRLLARQTERDDLRAELLRVCELLDSPADSRDAAQRVGPPVRLTARELDVLTCVAVGCGNVEIARRLRLSAETVKSYLREAMRKLGAHSRFEAVVLARRLGQLP